jgi:hypothetical protein
MPAPEPQQLLHLLGRQLYRVGQFLRRAVWQPLRRMMEIFHIVPLAGALLVFALLAQDGQVRELYLSYLEDLKESDPAAWTVRFGAAAVGLTLLSAAFYEAHYWLSTLRMNVIYSSLSNPDASSMLRGLQRSAAFCLALIPWLGLATGLLRAEIYLADRYRLLEGLNINVSGLKAIEQHLPAAPWWATVVFLLVFGAAAVAFLDRYRHHRLLQHLAVGIVPFAVAGLLVLLMTSRPQLPSSFPIRPALAFASIAGLYYLGYGLLRLRWNIIYRISWRPETGINWRRRQRIALAAWVLLPWVAVAIYFAITALFPGAAAESAQADPTGASENLPTAARWGAITLAMGSAIAVGLGVAILLDRFRESPLLRRTMIGLVGVLAATALFASGWGMDAVVSLYRVIGPLATMTLGLLFLFSTFVVLAVLSQNSGFPALTLLTLAIIVSAIFPIPLRVTAFVLGTICLILAAMAFLSRLWAVGTVALLLIWPCSIACGKRHGLFRRNRSRTKVTVMQ